MDVFKLSDQQLIESYLQGNEKSFEVLLGRHKDRIYTSIYLFVKDTEMAEDLFQEVFIKIIDTIRKGRYNHEGKFIQWALRISYNLCVDHFRKAKDTQKWDLVMVMTSWLILRHRMTTWKYL
jgi:RNA polymerase sigma factor (sigma-70 family)